VSLCIFFENLRGNFLSALKAPEERVKEAERLKSIDGTVAKLLKSKTKDKDVIKYIQNNRLAGYYVYLKERGILEPISNREELEKSVYKRLQKLLNTMNYLSAVGKELNTRFLLIKTLNVLPYLPVYDVDIFTETFAVIEKFEKTSDLYTRSDEKEKNKYNFIPSNDSKFFKLSFHTALTWDGVSIRFFNTNCIWKDRIEVIPHVDINSPTMEALIRLQECLLERLYFNWLDYIFISNYMNFSFICLPSKNKIERFPQFIKYKCLAKFQKSSPKLLVKNSLRYFAWQIYYKTTGKIPFHE